MEEKHKECSKCGGNLQAGHIMSPSMSAVNTVIHPNEAEWYAGKAKMAFLAYSMPAEKYPITVYRCKECGYLECYAE